MTCDHIKRKDHCFQACCIPLRSFAFYFAQKWYQSNMKPQILEAMFSSKIPIILLDIHQQHLPNIIFSYMLIEGPKVGKRIIIFLFFGA